MNINAGTNQYNLSLKKMKEEKRPTFATIFDKLQERSKKLNPKNPLNAVLTNEQMFRYYLEEVDPQLAGSVDKIDDLENAIGDNSLGEIKLRDFAKLLSGDLESTKATPIYETLTAGVSYSPMVAPLITPPSIATAPSGTGGAPSGTGGAPSGTGGAPSGTGGAPSGTGGAPSGTGGAPSGTGGAGGAGGAGGVPSSTGGVAGAFDGSSDGGYKDDKFIKVYNANKDLGNNPPTTTLNKFEGGNLEWFKQLQMLKEYNDKVAKDELKFPFSVPQKRILNALDYNIANGVKNPINAIFEQYKKNKSYFNQPLFKPQTYKTPTT